MRLTICSAYHGAQRPRPFGDAVLHHVVVHGGLRSGLCGDAAASRCRSLRGPPWTCLQDIAENSQASWVRDSSGTKLNRAMNMQINTGC